MYKSIETSIMEKRNLDHSFQLGGKNVELRGLDHSFESSAKFDDRERNKNGLGNCTMKLACHGITGTKINNTINSSLSKF
jgi:hypothetical protein